MRIGELLSAVAYKPAEKKLRFPDYRIKGVSIDSRECQEGYAFICIRGSICNGSLYAEEAIRRGARLLIAHESEERYLYEIISRYPECDGVFVEDERKAAALLAAKYEGEPAKSLKMIGVTGTKGKTTTVCMIRKILSEAGIPTGMAGTIGQFDGEKFVVSEHTTPDAVSLQKLLARMRDHGCKACVMEVSSQALKMKRTEGICFDIGVFLNLGEDHIGKFEHQDQEEYLACKRRLFLQSKEAFGNADDPAFEKIFEGIGCPVYTYGLRKGKSRAKEVQSAVFVDGHPGVEFDISGVHFRIPAPGLFTVSNALASVCVCRSCGVPEEEAAKSLRDFSVKGRMEFVTIPGGAQAVIDYAHNAMSLKSILETLRIYHPRRVITVFGCGGQRARDRRFRMGEVSGKLSDLTIITSDNPRWENPEAIMDDIESGIRKTSGKYLKITDRREAVNKAVDMAGPGDLIVLAGKGHETTQEIKGVYYQMDEVELVEEACTQKLL